jgi:flagellar hook-length control protein FliK
MIAPFNAFPALVLPPVLPTVLPVGPSGADKSGEFASIIRSATPPLARGDLPAATASLPDAEPQLSPRLEQRRETAPMHEVLAIATRLVPGTTQREALPPAALPHLTPAAALQRVNIVLRSIPKAETALPSADGVSAPDVIQPQVDAPVFEPAPPKAQAPDITRVEQRPAIAVTEVLPLADADPAERQAPHDAPVPARDDTAAVPEAAVAQAPSHEFRSVRLGEPRGHRGFSQAVVPMETEHRAELADASTEGSAHENIDPGESRKADEQTLVAAAEPPSSLPAPTPVVLPVPTDVLARTPIAGSLPEFTSAVPAPLVATPASAISWPTRTPSIARDKGAVRASVEPLAPFIAAAGTHKGTRVDLAPIVAASDGAEADTAGTVALPTETAQVMLPKPFVDTAPLRDVTVDRQLDLTRGDAWLDTLARDIAATATEGGRLRFVLVPENLGRLDIEMQTGDAGLGVQMTAGTEAARDILSAAQPRIVDDLRAQGVRIADVTVASTTSPDAGGPSDGSSQRARQLPTEFITDVDRVPEPETLTVRKPAAGRYA